MRFVGGSILVGDLNETLGSPSGLSPGLFNDSVLVWIVIAPVGIVVVVVVLPGVVVVVVLPPGTLPGSAGSLPASISVRSRKPSSSRSTPARVPLPGGTQV